MSEASEPAGRQKVLAYLLCYAFYVLLLVLAVALFFIWRTAIRAVVEATMPWYSLARSIVYLLPTTLMGFGVFILAMVAEPYLRTGIPRRDLVRRFARLAVPMSIALVLGLLITRLAATFS